MSKKLITEILSQESFFVLNKKITKAIGLNNSFILSFLIDKYKFFKNEFYCTLINISYETGLTEFTIKNCIKYLKANNFILVVKKGCPAQNFYNINFDKIEDIFENNDNEENNKKQQSNQNSFNIDNKNVELVVSNSPNQSGENQLTSEVVFNSQANENSPDYIEYKQEQINKNKETITNKKNIKKENEIIKKIPTLLEIQNYISFKKLNVNANDFFDYYEKRDWVDKNGLYVFEFREKLIEWHTRERLRQRQNNSNYDKTDFPLQQQMIDEIEEFKRTFVGFEDDLLIGISKIQEKYLGKVNDK